MNLAEQIRQEHPDWTDELVAAEVARREKPEPPANQPPAARQDNDAFARMRRENDELQGKLKEAENERAERERKQAEEEGKWRELAEQEKTRADQLEQKQLEKEQQRNAERAAGDLKFKDTGYALYLLQQDRVDLSDAAKVKEALEGLAKTRTDLVKGSAPPPSGGPAGGSNGEPPKLTREQLTAMTPKQIAALDPKVVNEALAA